MPEQLARVLNPQAAALSQAARGASGIPVPDASAPAGGGGDQLTALLEQLRSGQMSAEQLIALLTALTGLGAGGVPAAPASPNAGNPIEAAMLGLGGQNGGP